MTSVLESINLSKVLVKFQLVVTDYRLECWWENVQDGFRFKLWDFQQKGLI